MKNPLISVLLFIFIVFGVCYVYFGTQANSKIDQERRCVVVQKKDVVDGREHKGMVTYQTKHVLTVKYTKSNGKWSEKYEDLFVEDNTYYTTNVGDVISFELRNRDYEYNIGEIYFMIIFTAIAIFILVGINIE